MLDDVAKIILRDRFDDFKRAYHQFRAGEDLAAMDQELARLTDEDSGEDGFLWAFAYCSQRMGWIDWTGEEDPGQLKRFVDARIESLTDTKLDWSFLEDFDRKIDFKKLKRGEYIVKKLSCIDGEIRKKGFLIAMFDRGDDQYYPFIASIEEFRGINGEEIGFTTIKAWADQCQA